MIAPSPIGNADPEWQIQRIPGQDGVLVVQMGQIEPVMQADMVHNPLPRKCVWAMLLLSCLLVLRVQQERYAEVVHWRGGVPDMGNPFPWELSALVSADDKFESTFLSPVLRKASTFSRSSAEASMLITGLARTVVTGGDDSASSGISAVTSAAHFPPPICFSNTSTCYMGLQRATNVPARARLQLSVADPSQQQPIACHRFLAGDSVKGMRPLPLDNRSQLLCLRSNRIQSLVPLSANGTTIVAWEYKGAASDSRLLKATPACVALVSPDLRVAAAMLAISVSTVLYDQGSNLFITVGFSSLQTLVVHVFDPLTLEPLWKYRLPLEVGWLLRAPRVSNGFLLFVGAQEPFLGTVFTIDLNQRQVYEQDAPPVGNRHQRPRRRRLPRNMVLEAAPTQTAAERANQVPALCNAVVVAERKASTLLSKSDHGVDATRPSWTGDKAGPPGE